MRVMVAGSREWTDKQLIEASLIVTNITLRSGAPIVTLIHSGAKGAERFAVEAADELGWGLEVYPLDRRSQSKIAIARHSVKMLESGVDLLLVYSLAEAWELKHLLDTAKKLNIPGKVHNAEV